MHQSGIFRSRRRSVTAELGRRLAQRAGQPGPRHLHADLLHGRADATAARFAAAPGQPVTTSIDMRYQLAASQAVRSAKTTKPIDMVVIQPSTGKVLAVVERPGGFDRALLGEFPPGSTFKVVTSPPRANGPNPPSHGWFIGYRGDVAFAVLVEGGGLGADSAGPIANAFLRNL